MKRIKKIEFRVTRTEHLFIRNKADKAGCTVSEFLRNTAMGYPITYKLSPEELEVYKQLNKFSDNFRKIGNLYKLGDVTGVKETSVATAKLIRSHLNKLK